MDSITVGFWIFSCLIGGAVLGMLLKKSFDDAHLSDSTKDIISAARGLIIGLTALTTGLLVTGAKSSYELKTAEIRKQAADITMLGRVLYDYGPGAEHATQVLKNGVVGEIKVLTALADDGLAALKKTGSTGMDKLRLAVLDLKADTENKSILKNSAFSLSQSIIGAQMKLFYEKDSTIQWPLIFLLVFWLTAVFFSFGVLSPVNGISIAALIISAMSMSVAICLTMEYDAPYNGFITISPSPLEEALTKF